MDARSLFGLGAVTSMLVAYASGRATRGSRSPSPAPASSARLGSSYGLLQGAWPFGLVETI